MKSFLSIVIAALIFTFSVRAFVHFFTFKHIPIALEACNSESSCISLLQTKDCERSKQPVVKKISNTGIYNSMQKKYKCHGEKCDRTIISYPATELTLEYIALQSTRSY